MSKVTSEELEAFFDSMFPGRDETFPSYPVVKNDFVQMRQQVDHRHLRPGGYISGPTQMALADHAAYVAIFTRTGIIPMAVTSNLNIDFLRPCIGKAVIADAKLIKLGKNLAVTTVDMRAEGNEKLSSRATVTYVVPSK
ncbi:MAG: PaaI family thioesterase [Alphaproteobacteria bacterium]